MRQRANWAIWSICAVLVAGVCSSPAAPARRGTPPRTVVDYYLLLPTDDYFLVGSRKNRLDQLSGGIIDTRNGYLAIRGNASTAPLTVCLFRRPDRSYLVAVNHNLAPDDGSWEPCLDFYRYRNGRLVKVTCSTLPRRFSKKLGYKLPRYGTIIKVITESGRTAYEMPWVNGRFRVRRV